jgi:hypothetical protein
MITIVISAAAGIVSGVVVGIALGLWLSRRTSNPRELSYGYTVDPDLDSRIMEASRRWASQQASTESYSRSPASMQQWKRFRLLPGRQAQLKM